MINLFGFFSVEHERGVAAGMKEVNTRKGEARGQLETPDGQMNEKHSITKSF